VKRPKWSKPLNREDWQHLREAQAQRPTLRALKLDAEAGNCVHCTRIMRKLTPES